MIEGQKNSGFRVLACGLVTIEVDFDVWIGERVLHGLLRARALRESARGFFSNSFSLQRGAEGHTFQSLALGLCCALEDSVSECFRAVSTAMMWPRGTTKGCATARSKGGNPYSCLIDRSSSCGSRLWRPMILRLDAGSTGKR